jgi:GATA zinc finger domain-containing protein 14
MDKLLQNLVLLEHLHRNLQQTKQKDLENVSFDEEEISFINDTYKDEEKSIFYQKNKYMYELLKNGYQLQADKNKLIVYVDDVKIVGDKGKVLNFPNTKEERQTLTQNIIKDFCIYESNSQEETKDKINTNETTQNIDAINKKDEFVENKQNEIDDNENEVVDTQSSETVHDEPSETVCKPNVIVPKESSATIDDNQSNEANDSSSEIIENQTNENNTEIENNYSEEENNDIKTESNDINSNDYNEKEVNNNQIVHNTNTDVNTNTNDKINEGFYFDLGENEDDDLLNNINFNENLFNGENENNSKNHENKEKTEIDNNEKSENKDNKTNSLFNFDNHNDFNFMNNFNEEFMNDDLDIDLTENDLGEIDFGENDLTKNDFNKNDLNKNINLEETNLENYDENNLIEEELNKIMNEPDQELFVFNDNKSNDLTNKQKEVYVENENINNNKILNDNDIYNDANDTDTNTDSDIDNINVDFNLEDLKNGNFDFNFSDENNDKSNEEENENENELNANENNLSDSETNENSEANENQNIDNEYNNSNDEPNENSDLDENKFDDDNFIFNFNEENLENETLFNFGESENNNVDLSSKDDNTNLNIHSDVDDTQNDKNSNENSNVNSNDNSIFNENAFDEEKTVLETPIFKEPEKPKLNFITNTIDEDSLTMLEKLKEDKEDYDLSMLETLINEDVNNKEEVFNLSLGNFEQKEFDLEKENEKLNLVADEVINNSKNDTLINAKLNDTTISDPINDPINDPIKNTENVDSENEKEIKNDNLTLSGKEENEKLTDYFVSEMQEESDFRREKTKFIKDIVNIEIDFTDGNYHKVDNLRMVIFPLNTASNGTDIATDICAYIEQDDGYIIEYMLPQSKRIIEFHNNDYVIFVKGFWENGQFGSQVRIFSNKGEIKTNIETTKIRPDNNENLGIGHNVIFLDYATTLHLMPIEKQDGTIPVIGVTIKNIGFGESSGDSKLGDPTMIVSGETYKYEVSGYWKDDYFEVNSQIYTPKNMN